MSQHPLDHPQIIANLFYPRPASPVESPDGSWQDGTIPVEDNIELGYRLFVNQPDSPMILYFHGNGEIVSDYVHLYPYYQQRVGVSLLVVDYRGYGWSTGTPLTSKMLPDARVVLDHLPRILEAHHIKADVPVFIKGRSLGSAPAIYLGLIAPEKFNGLIIESGYADAPSLFRRLGFTLPDGIKTDDTLPIANDEKIKRVQLPLLVIHGEEDNLIPVTHGQRLQANSPVEDKRLVVITGAGHNNLIFIAFDDYFNAINQFVNNHI